MTAASLRRRLDALDGGSAAAPADAERDAAAAWWLDFFGSCERIVRDGPAKREAVSELLATVLREAGVSDGQAVAGEAVDCWCPAGAEAGLGERNGP